jgi:hypothetical protein
MTINALWFQDKDSDGIIYYEYFAPIPIRAIAIVLTVVRIEATPYHLKFWMLTILPSVIR